MFEDLAHSQTLLQRRRDAFGRKRSSPKESLRGESHGTMAG